MKMVDILKYFFFNPFYFLGFGVDQNLSYALNYYKFLFFLILNIIYIFQNNSKAANLEHGPSLNKLGDFFHSGIGVQRKDLSKAIQYYETAANLNNADSLINLG